MTATAGRGTGGIRRLAVPDGATSAMCKHCGRIKPLAELIHHKGRPSRVCKACAVARAKVLAEDRLRYGTQREVDQAPDPRPAIRVRLELERDRAAGLSWHGNRFARHVRAATAGDEEWAAVLRDQASIWKRAYQRRGKPILTLALDLVDDPERPVVEHGSRLVA